MSRSSIVRVPLVCALPFAVLGGCAQMEKVPPSEQSAAMTSAPAVPMQQAPAQTPQTVKTPLPPATKGPAVPPASSPPPPSSSSTPTAGPYVAAQIGYGQSRNANFKEDNPAAPDCFLFVTATTCGGTLNNMGASAVFGISAGYRFGPMLRADIGYQRHGGYNLSGWDPAGTYYDPPVTSNAMIVTGFLDYPEKIGGWFRPYVGLGIGVSRNKMNSLNWFDPTCCSGTLNSSTTTNSFAWQGSLGAAISLDSVAKGLVLDIMYRYSDLGDFKKAAGFDQVGNFSGSGTTTSATGNIRSNEFLFGIRWEY